MLLEKMGRVVRFMRYEIRNEVMEMVNGSNCGPKNRAEVRENQ